MKVAIVGRCETSRRMAPESDEWEAWQLAWDMEPMGNVTRWFEVHTPNLWNNGTISDLYTQYGGYKGWLEAIVRDQWGDLVLNGPFIEGASVFPMDGIMKLPGLETGYLESSIAYMLVQAFYDGVTHCGIWGADMSAEDEYAYQRPNMAYLIGLFRAQGMKIVIPTISDLRKLDPCEDMPIPTDWVDTDMDRFSLEYLLGRHVGETGQIPKELRPDLMTSIFTDPPRYGYRELPNGSS